MRIARISGRVSASVKTGRLTGRKMLIADYVDSGGNVREPGVVITDACGAGPGDIVLVATGSAARTPAETAGVPTDATAVAFVDQMSIGPEDVDLARLRESPQRPPARRRTRG